MTAKVVNAHYSQLNIQSLTLKNNCYDYDILCIPTQSNVNIISHRHETVHIDTKHSSPIIFFAGKIHFDDLNFNKAPYDSLVSYRQSKLANLLFTRELARRIKGLFTQSPIHQSCLNIEKALKNWILHWTYLFRLCFKSGSGVTVYSLHPGVIRTELGRYVQTRHPLLSALLSFPALLLMKTPRQGAQTSIYCAVAEGLETHNGCYFRWAVHIIHKH